MTDMGRMFALLQEHQDVSDRPDAVALGAITPARGEIGLTRWSLQKRAGSANFASESVSPGIARRSNRRSGRLERRRQEHAGTALSALRCDWRCNHGGRPRLEGLHAAKSARAAIGIVPQDTVLFNDTLAYTTCTTAIRRQMRMQCRPPFARRDWMHLSPSCRRLDTTVGERGLKLWRRKARCDCPALLKTPRS